MTKVYQAKHTQAVKVATTNTRVVRPRLPTDLHATKSHSDPLLGGPAFVDEMRKQFDAARCIKPPVTFECVVAAVSHSFEVPSTVVQRSGRHGNGAREAAVMLCRELVATNLATLGSAFGGVSGVP